MDAAIPAATASPVVGATVTYADRAASCLATVDAMRAEGVDRVVIVDNGSDAASADLLAAYAHAHPHVVKLHRMPRNEGSAPAFAAAIELARGLGTGSVWLLDDDNLPVPGALDALRARDESLFARGVALRAVAPTRAASFDTADIEAAIRQGASREAVREDRSFGGVDLGVFVRRGLERLGLRRPRPAPVARAMPSAPYGGLLLGVDVIDAIGLPDSEFVLYGDDLEYTSRIIALGGRIEQCDAAVVVDPRGERWMPAGFEIRAMFRSTNDALLYYFLRNRIVRELRTGRRRSMARSVNGCLFGAFCVACAVVTRRPRTLGVIGRAVRDAVRSRLGRRVEI